ncbi:putative short-chain dehydrogenase [Xylogone sp. PMI_703]|nr:putative short-chain dehydrogenase [Xylogone sp. PMI_703]
MSAPVLLVLGAGNNVGLHTASHFARQEAIKGVFDQVRAQLGEPNVVLYNAVFFARPKEYISDIPIAAYQRSLQINTVAPYLSAQLSIESVSKVTNGGPKTFIFTGNCLNVKVLPRFWSFGSAKSATAHIIIAASMYYENRGYRFYYVDERTPEGEPVMDDLSGEANAEIFWEIEPVEETGKSDCYIC